MPFFPAMSNVRGIIVKRPTANDVGGKKRFEILHDDLAGYFEENSELVTNREGSTRVVVGIVLLPARDRRRAVVDVQADDELEFDDYRGVRQSRRVVRATPERDHLQRLDHIVVEVA
jgi:hypothetical protein